MLSLQEAAATQLRRASSLLSTTASAARENRLLRAPMAGDVVPTPRGGSIVTVSSNATSEGGDPGSARCPAAPSPASIDEVPQTWRGVGGESDTKLVVCNSRALSHLFTRIRDRNTPPPRFAFYASRMMRILAEEGIACLKSSRPFITTPTGATFSSILVDETNVCVVSILRGGDPLASAAQACLPDAPMGKVLIQRDEESEEKRPILFYKKFPVGIATMQILLCDPMLATGGSAIMAVRTLVETGVREDSIVFVTVVCVPEGLAALRAEFPGVTVVTAAMDDCLDERKYIVPGLGDFGDRLLREVSFGDCKTGDKVLVLVKGKHQGLS